MNIIKVSDFSEYPGLRHCEISDDSGELFYHNVMNESFKRSFEKHKKLYVNLDNTAGYAPSFLDEAFGNLVYDFGLNVVEKYLSIISEQEPDLIEIIENQTFPQWQQRRENHSAPKKTQKHSSWWFLDEDGNINNRS